MKVLVVTMNGSKEFDTFEEAKKEFNIDMENTTHDFTNAMRDGDRIRFESWEVYNLLSM